MSDHALSDAPQNPLHERYASRRMAHLFSARHRFETWRRLWIVLAECQAELGLPITEAQLDALRRAAPEIDLERVAEIERATRHDVVAHLRHFAEQAGEAGGILHLGATSAFVTDNTDALLTREALEILRERLAATVRALADFARRHRDRPALAYTHFQPAQLTTVGKRACLWIQDFLEDLAEVEHRLATLRCRGVKGTTGTQASYLTLFDGDHDKITALDRMVAERLGFPASWAVTGQTYPRKQDSRVLQTLAGIGESAHKLGTDLRLLQGVGELAEPFDDTQVGSSAMAYKRNPVRAERMCGLARRLITDSPQRTPQHRRPVARAEPRRLGQPAPGDPGRPDDRRRRAVARLPHRRGAAGRRGGGGDPGGPGAAVHGDRDPADEGGAQGRRPPGAPRAHPPLLVRVARGHGGRHRQPPARQDRRRPGLPPDPEEIDDAVDARAFTGRSAEQVDAFLAEHVDPAVARIESAAIESPRI